MKYVLTRPTAAILRPELVFRDNLLAVFCALGVACGLYLLR